MIAPIREPIVVRPAKNSPFRGSSKTKGNNIVSGGIGKKIDSMIATIKRFVGLSTPVRWRSQLRIANFHTTPTLALWSPKPQNTSFIDYYT